MARLGGAAKVIERPELPATMEGELVAAGLSKAAAGEIVEATRRHIINHRLVASSPRSNKETRGHFSNIEKSSRALLRQIEECCGDVDRNDIIERNLAHWHTDRAEIEATLHMLHGAAARALAGMPEDKGGSAVPTLEGFVARLAEIYERDTGRAAGRSYNDASGTYGGPFFRVARLALDALPHDVAGGKRADGAVAKLIREAMDITRG